MLDPSRLGNQIYREALTLIRGGWPNHPAARMWEGHTHALASYGLAGLKELNNRGRFYPHHEETFRHFLDHSEDTGLPWWFGDPDFHKAHRSNLLRKDRQHYSGHFEADLPDDLPYLWPAMQTKTYKIGIPPKGK